MLRKIFYEIILTNSEPLRIGGPDDPLSGEHNAVARVGSMVVIPGSSLKGALRAAIEHWLVDQHYQNGSWKPGAEQYKPCIPADRPSPDEQALINAGKYRGPNCRYRNTPKDIDRGHQPICPVCYFLGAMGLEGFVRVPFLNADVSANKLYSSRIDRAIKTVAEKTNRPYELVPPDTQFKGNLEVVIEDTLLGWRLGSPRKLGERSLGDKWLEQGNSSDSAGLIQQYLIERLKSIQIMGGYKSKGFGRVKIEVQKID